MRNVLILIHGMVTERDASDHRIGYAELMDNLALFNVRPSDFDAVIGIEWGHEQITDPPRPLAELREDERLTRAEASLHDRISQEAVKSQPSPYNHLLGSLGDGPVSLATRGLTRQVKDAVMLYGITDAIYYASKDGEDAIRSTVYSQALKGMDPFTDSEGVRLFVIAHSLGVTVAHDFLFGLFAPHHTPDFAQPESDPDATQPGKLDAAAVYRGDKDRYLFWREAAQGGEGRPPLTLGAFITAGGQLGLMTMRKQTLIDRLAAGENLDPADIGVGHDGSVRWLNFYDVDDVLGFPSRQLYGDYPTIVDYQVNTGNLGNAHTHYWTDDLVGSLIAELLRDILSERSLGH